MGSNHTYRYIIVNDIEPADMGTTLEASSWQAIAYHASIGDLSNYVSIGDTKSTIINNTRFYTKLIDFNHGGSINTVDFMTITAACETKYNIAYQYTSGYAGSNARSYLDYWYMTYMQSTLTKYIIEKDVITEVNWGSQTISSKNKIWLLTEKEIGLTSCSHQYEQARNITYPVFIDNNSRIMVDYYNTPRSWLLASPSAASSINGSYAGWSVVVNTSGTTYNLQANTTAYTVVGFRLGKNS